jgi:hypothetical protein
VNDDTVHIAILYHFKSCHLVNDDACSHSAPLQTQLARNGCADFQVANQQIYVPSAIQQHDDDDNDDD